MCVRVWMESIEIVSPLTSGDSRQWRRHLKMLVEHEHWTRYPSNTSNLNHFHWGIVLCFSLSFHVFIRFDYTTPFTHSIGPKGSRKKVETGCACNMFACHMRVCVCAFVMWCDVKRELYVILVCMISNMMIPLSYILLLLSSTPCRKSTTNGTEHNVRFVVEKP